MGVFPRPWFWSSLVQKVVSHPGKKNSPSMVLNLSQGKEGKNLISSFEAVGKVIVHSCLVAAVQHRQ